MVVNILLYQLLEGGRLEKWSRAILRMCGHFIGRAIALSRMHLLGLLYLLQGFIKGVAREREIETCFSLHAIYIIKFSSRVLTLWPS